MQKDFVPWFIALIEKDMKEQNDDIDTKQLIYQNIQREILDKEKRETDE